MSEGVSVVIFEGTAAASPVEEMINSVRQALLHDNLEKLGRVGLVEKVFLMNNPALRDGPTTGAVMILNGSIHFTRRELKKLVLSRPDKVFTSAGLVAPSSPHLNQAIWRGRPQSFLTRITSVSRWLPLPSRTCLCRLPAMDNSLHDAALVRPGLS